MAADLTATLVVDCIIIKYLFFLQLRLIQSLHHLVCLTILTSLLNQQKFLNKRKVCFALPLHMRCVYHSFLHYYFLTVGSKLLLCVNVFAC